MGMVALVLCAVCGAMCVVQYAVCCMRCAVCGVRCDVCCVLCAVCSPPRWYDDGSVTSLVFVSLFTCEQAVCFVALQLLDSSYSPILAAVRQYMLR